MLEFELVLPCYNEEKSLETILKRAVEAAKESGYTPETFQLALVENGSKDNSSAVMDQLKASPLGVWFRKVPVNPNLGYGWGVWTGLQSTTAKYVSWSHADQQCDPKDAFRALDIIKKSGNDKLLVKGRRTGRDWKDKFVSRTFETLAWFILGIYVYDTNAQPKVFSRNLLSHLKNPPLNFAFDLYVLFNAKKAGYQFETISVLFPPRIHGMSNWASNFAGRYKTFLNMIAYMFRLSRDEGRS